MSKPMKVRRQGPAIPTMTPSEVKAIALIHVEAPPTVSITCTASTRSIEIQSNLLGPDDFSKRRPVAQDMIFKSLLCRLTFAL